MEIASSGMRAFSSWVSWAHSAASSCTEMSGTTSTEAEGVLTVGRAFRELGADNGDFLVLAS